MENMILIRIANEMGKSLEDTAQYIFEEYYKAVGTSNVFSDSKPSEDELIRIATNILNDEIKIYRGDYTIHKVELGDITKCTPTKPEPYLPELKKFLDKFC